MVRQELGDVLASFDGAKVPRQTKMVSPEAIIKEETSNALVVLLGEGSVQLIDDLCGYLLGVDGGGCAGGGEFPHGDVDRARLNTISGF